MYRYRAFGWVPYIMVLIGAWELGANDLKLFDVFTTVSVPLRVDEIPRRIVVLY